MRLTTKLVLSLFVCVVVTVGLNAVLTVRGEVARYESDLAKRHLRMGTVLRAAFRTVAENEGEARAVSVLKYTDSRVRRTDIRWVALDADAPPERRPIVGRAALAPLRSDVDVHEKWQGHLVSYVPVHIEGRDVTALEFSESLDEEHDVVRSAVIRELRVVGVMALAILLVSGFLGLVLVARPMRRLVNVARRVGQGDLSTEPAPTGKDEIAELAREMNAMCLRLAEANATKLQVLEQLRRAERLSTVGTLASGLAHEIGTPLNVVALRAKAIAQGRATDERAKEAARTIVEQATRMTNLVAQLLDFARRKPPQRDAVDVRRILRSVTDLLQSVAGKANVKLVVEAPGPLPAVRGDPSQLEQVVTNLVLNAVQAMPDGGAVTLSTDVVSASAPPDAGGEQKRCLRVKVADEGVGIPDDVLPHIFEPFFTTKAIGDGTGLGLAVCYGIVRDHGGWIDASSRPGHGSELAVFLPTEEP